MNITNEEIHLLVGRLVVESNHAILDKDREIQSLILPLQKRVEELSQSVESLKMEKFILEQQLSNKI